MSRKFILTNAALDDLREIAKHYRSGVTNDHVEAWLSGLIAAVDDLMADADLHPEAFEARRVTFNLRQKLYGTRQHKYRILFALLPDEVRVLRIWHGARRRVRPGDINDLDT